MNYSDFVLYGGIFMKIDAFMFDLDGTLWDATDGILKAWNEVLSKKKVTKELITKEQMKSVMGLQLYAIGKRFFPQIDKKERTELMDECCKVQYEYLIKEGGHLYDNLEETLRKLSENHQLFIISNCQDGYVQTFLEFNKFNKYFTDFQCAGDTGLSKGENIRIMADKHKLKNPVYVGDTQGDCNAANVAGMPFVYAKYGFGNVDRYDFIINKPSELLDIAGKEL